MQSFDCLALSTPILGPHFLEASAGTGKTFAIEHIVARLLLLEDPGYELEQILVVTFTKAAARELRLRIRMNLERIVKELKEGACPWEYLRPYQSSQKAIRKLMDALATFDRASIFTIHAFCFRALKEHAFEAGLGLGIQESCSSASLDLALRDFFESKLQQEIICPEQMGLLLKQPMETLVRRLKNNRIDGAARTFQELAQSFSEALEGCGYVPNPEYLKSDYEALAEGCKSGVKGRFDLQVDALGAAFQNPEASFRKLIGEKGSLFAFLAPENRKVRAKAPVALHYPEFFSWASRSLDPLVEEAADVEKIMQLLSSFWSPIGEKIAEQEGQFGPDDILRVMKQAVQREEFLLPLQKKYQAALIDEFQDTDPIQWEIFQTLFANRSIPFYLVGDPKQSIYRFRNADLYTYLKARESFQSEAQYQLDTNFRSSPELIESLNRLFDRKWLSLPKEGKDLPYYPVRAGLPKGSSLSDGKAALHAFQYDGGSPEQAIAYAADQIIRLKPHISSLSSFAVLVKDRHMAHAVQSEFAARGIESIARSHELLSESFAFEAIEELLAALEDPKDLGKAKAVMGGPFGGCSAEELRKIDFSPFQPLREELEKLGFASFCSLLWKTHLGAFSVQDLLASRGGGFYSDCLQVLELLFEWERNEGFSFEGVFSFLESVHQMDGDDAPFKRKEADTDAVQIMTMHVSKGLEFEIVFALGLAARTPRGDEESDAEKLRQLYVAMTRAKKRLYIPIPSFSKEAAAGTQSPIELFCKYLPIEEIKTILEIEAVGQIPLQSLARGQPPAMIEPEKQRPMFASSYLLSFSSMAQEKEREKLAPLQEAANLFTMHNLPRGPETGVAVHAIFERIFRKDPSSFEKIAREELCKASLTPWEKPVLEMVHQTLSLTLPTGFSLRDISFDKVLVESEFFFPSDQNFVKGFIDLLFEHEGKYYFVDWKTNWLGPDCTAYTVQTMHRAIHDHQYDLQARLYAESLRRATGPDFSSLFGGAIYLFVRGPAAALLKEEL